MVFVDLIFEEQRYKSMKGSMHLRCIPTAIFEEELT